MSEELPGGTGYRPFPEVSEWPASVLDLRALDRLTSVIERLSVEPPAVMTSAVEVVKRAAAIETGAIENLYEHDRGITITAAISAAALDALRQGSSAQKSAYIGSQLNAYDFVLDMVTTAQPISEVRIRELHAVLCGAQENYTRYGPEGEKQEVPLLKGRYKSEDNRVLLLDGRLHSYASHFATPGEMERLIRNVLSSEFKELHPVDQAAYLHYAFVAIHPFADGNGRVARALTSIPTYRHYRVPILITSDQRQRYFDALEAADAQDFELFRTFIRNRIAESIEFLDLSVRRAKNGTPEQVAQQIARNNFTPGGYSHVALDEAARGLLINLERDLNQILGAAGLRPAGVNWSVSRPQANREASSGEFRRLISSPQEIVKIHGFSAAPAEANWVVNVGVEIPVDADASDVFRLECGSADQPNISLVVTDVVPERSFMTDMKLRLFAEEVLNLVGVEVARLGAETIAKRGYVKK